MRTIYQEIALTAGTGRASARSHIGLSPTIYHIVADRIRQYDAVSCERRGRTTHVTIVRVNRVRVVDRDVQCPGLRAPRYPSQGYGDPHRQVQEGARWPATFQIRSRFPAIDREQVAVE